MGVEREWVRTLCGVLLGALSGDVVELCFADEGAVELACLARVGVEQLFFLLLLCGLHASSVDRVRPGFFRNKFLM